MTNNVDRACELENRQREQAIQNSKPAAEIPRELDGHRYCLGCDFELNTERLLITPEAVRCVPCQGSHEREQSQIYQGRL